MVLNVGKSRWFVVERALLPLLFKIYLTGMAEELEKSQLGFKLEGCWCGTLMYMLMMLFWW